MTACWAITSKLRLWNPTLFPGPGEVLASLVAGVRDGSLVYATVISLRRMVLGFSLSFALGVPLGLGLARSKALDETVGVLVLGLQTLPSICWLPLAILWFGLNDAAILFVVVIGSFLAITVTVRDGVRNLPPSYLRAAQTMGTPPLAQFTQVLLPASLPALVTGAKLGWSFAWRSLLAGELLFVNRGLGYQLMMGRDLADMGRVISVMLVIVGLGLLTDRLVFAELEGYVRERWGYGRG